MGRWRADSDPRLGGQGVAALPTADRMSNGRSDVQRPIESPKNSGPCLFCEYPLQVLQTLRRDYFRAFLIFEDLNGHGAVVPHVFQRLGDRPKIDLTEAGAFEILVIGVHVGELAFA